ncbi:MAG: RHS repeat-associated core domain-containing protein, partial [Balneolaceae bacterium]
NRPIEIGAYSGGTDFDSANPDVDTFPTSGHTANINYYYDGDHAPLVSGYTPNNANGRLTKISYRNQNTPSGWSHEGYSYNDLGPVEWKIVDLRSLNTLKLVKYHYDDLGRRTRTDYQPTNSAERFITWNEYDDYGRLKYVYTDTDTVIAGRVKEAEYTYTVDGQVEKLDLGYDPFFVPSVHNSYNIRGWLTNRNSSVSHSMNWHYGFDMELEYNANGTISKQSWLQGGGDPSQKVNYAYSYDAANRLIGANFTGSGYNSSAFDVSYGYDKNGNMSWSNRFDNTGTWWLKSGNFSMFNNSNRIQYFEAFNTTFYTMDYDANGNVIENEVQGLTGTQYDWRNLPSQMQAGSVTLQYDYNAEGHRTEKRIGNTVTHYVRGKDGEVLATYVNNVVKSQPIYAGGEMIGNYDRTQRRYYLKDHLGSIRTTINENGATEGYDDYYPFGLAMPGRSSNSANPNDNYKFTGHELDDEAGLNLINAGARMLDPVLGRFMQIDVLHDVYASLSPYNYVGNNPLNAIDPDGRLIVFINGMHGGDGGSSKYWGGQDQVAINYYNDHNNLYLDGSVGGALGYPSNLSPRWRRFAGGVAGNTSASTIFLSLAPGEKIRVITHSMGGAYARGFVESLKDYAKHTLGWTDEEISGVFEYELDVAMFNSGSRALKSTMEWTFQAGHDSDIVAGNEDMWAGPGTKVWRLKTKVTVNDGKNVKDHSITAFSMKDLIEQIENLLKEDE